MSPRHFDHCDDAYSLSIRVQTTLNHIRFVKLPVHVRHLQGIRLFFFPTFGTTVGQRHREDVRVKIFHSIDSELLVSEMQKKMEVTVFVSEIKHVENYPDFEKLALVIHYGLQWFIRLVKNIEGESTEANDLSLIL